MKILLFLLLLPYIWYFSGRTVVHGLLRVVDYFEQKTSTTAKEET